jgi:hypothetical protein
MFRIISAFWIGLILATSGAAAQTSTPAQADTESADVAFNQSLTDFGVLAGRVNGCVEANALAAHEERVFNMFSRIVQLYGTDRAFRFSAAYGHGATLEVEEDKCPEVIATFEAQIATAKGETSANQ